ncbi:hypothetical protein VTJ49DRAFT_647 [Mycothermus thermophilus]|uniref:BHLH domain-containing protein n=1 Tax=Humicola insolens TaxID=85995 RepID=A0ABR3VEK7_HUMIN
MDGSASTASSLGSSGSAYPTPALLDETMWSYFCAGRSASGLHANAMGSLEPWQTLESTSTLEGRDLQVLPMTPGSWTYQATELASPPISTVGLQPNLVFSNLARPTRLQLSWSSESSPTTTAAFPAITTSPQDNPDDPTLKRIKTEPQTQTQPRRPNIQLRTAARKKRKSSRSLPSATTTSPASCSPAQTVSPPSSSSPRAAEDDDNDDDGNNTDNANDNYNEDDGLTPEARRARHNHNRVEKHYRRRLNVQFARLLDVLMLPVPPARAPSIESATTVKRGRGGGDGLGVVDVGGGRGDDGIDEKRISKAEVLELAARRIRELEKDKETLVRERKELVRNIEVLMMAGTVGRGVF